MNLSNPRTLGEQPITAGGGAEGGEAQGPQGACIADKARWAARLARCGTVRAANSGTDFRAERGRNYVKGTRSSRVATRTPLGRFRAEGNPEKSWHARATIYE
jgi:hypothetical protein